MKDAGTRGRPRRAETDHRLMSAALELLRERGPAAVTIDGVTARSGVARTTIYRRFTSRRELLAAAIAAVVDRPLPPGDLSLEAKLRWELGQVRELFDSGLGKGALGAILDEADPEFTGPLRRALESRLEPLREQIEADMDAGRVARRTDPDVVVDLLLGAYLAEVLRHGAPRDAWVGDTVDFFIRALAPRPDAG